METIDFLISEYKWCMFQYNALGYESYLVRANNVKKEIDKLEDLYNEMDIPQAA